MFHFTDLLSLSILLCFFVCSTCDIIHKTAKTMRMQTLAYFISLFYHLNEFQEFYKWYRGSLYHLSLIFTQLTQNKIFHVPFPLKILSLTYKRLLLVIYSRTGYAIRISVSCSCFLIMQSVMTCSQNIGLKKCFVCCNLHQGTVHVCIGLSLASWALQEFWSVL